MSKTTETLARNLNRDDPAWDYATEKLLLTSNVRFLESLGQGLQDGGSFSILVENLIPDIFTVPDSAVDDVYIGFALVASIEGGFFGVVANNLSLLNVGNTTGLYDCSGKRFVGSGSDKTSYTSLGDYSAFFGPDEASLYASFVWTAVNYGNAFPDVVGDYSDPTALSDLIATALLTGFYSAADASAGLTYLLTFVPEDDTNRGMVSFWRDAFALAAGIGANAKKSSSKLLAEFSKVQKKGDGETIAQLNAELNAVLLENQTLSEEVATQDLQIQALQHRLDVAKKLVNLYGDSTLYFQRLAQFISFFV